MAYDQLITKLRQRFPELKPATHAPPLLKLRLHDGLSLVGRRGEDAETGTYIKTFTLRFFGIPLFLFPAFRVLEWKLCLRQAGNGQGEGAAIARYCELREDSYIFPWQSPENPASYYIVGRERLSAVAQIWNAFVALVIVVLIVQFVRPW